MDWSRKVNPVSIENFWNQAKRHLRKFNGVPQKHFPLFLKECQWRFNQPNPKTPIAPVKSMVKSILNLVI